MTTIVWAQRGKNGERRIKQRWFENDAKADKFIARKMKTESFIEIVAGR